MAEENSNQEREFSPIDYAKAYQMGRVAATLGGDKNGVAYLPGALTLLHENLKSYTKGPAEIYKKVMDASDDAKATLIKIASNDYEERKNEIKLRDLFDWYKESIDSDENSEILGKFRALFSDYLEKSTKEIKDEIEDADYKLNPRTKNISDEEKEAAKKAIKERKELLGKLGLLESYSLEKGRHDAVKASVKPNLEELVK